MKVGPTTRREPIPMATNALATSATPMMKAPATSGGRVRRRYQERAIIAAARRQAASRAISARKSSLLI